MLHHKNYQSSIASVVKSFKNKHPLANDDLTQALWERLLNILPDYKTKALHESPALLYTILKNYAIDLLRIEETKKGINMPLLFDVNEHTFDDFVDSAFYKFERQLTSPQQKAIEIAEIKQVLSVWRENASPKALLLVDELFNPCEFTLKKWEMLKNKIPMYKMYGDSIPVTTLGKMLGISPMTVKKTMEDIRFHFNCYSYNIH